MKYLIGIVGVIALGMIAWQFTLNSTNVSENNSEAIVQSQIQIVTSIYPLAYLAEAIGGDSALVTNIGEGQDPHDFRPSVSDIKTMQDADMVVLQGAELEPWGDDIITQLENTDVRVVVVSENLDLIEFKNSHAGHDEHHEHEGDKHSEEDDHHDDEDHHDDHHEEEGNHDDHDGHDHGKFDPHTWLDPVLMIAMAEDITASLISLDAANTDMYQANLGSLRQELQSLNEEYTRTLSNCSLEEVITSHDAFGYVAQRYDFKIHPIVGLSTQDTPSVVTLAKLKEEAQEGINAILLEENSIASYGETLARETGLETLPISPIVYNIPSGQSYPNVMRSNLSTFAKALQCNE